jgi:predicted nucleic acid-binding protein
VAEPRYRRHGALLAMLIAATCRERGATLLTANVRDFDIIKRVIGLRFAKSFPV